MRGSAALNRDADTTPARKPQNTAERLWLEAGIGNFQLISGSFISQITIYDNTAAQKIPPWDDSSGICLTTFI